MSATIALGVTAIYAAPLKCASACRALRACGSRVVAHYAGYRQRLTLYASFKLLRGRNASDSATTAGDTMPSFASKTISFKIPVNWLYGIVALAVVLIAAFVWLPERWRPVLVFGAAVIAGAAGLITAANNVDQRTALAAKAASQAHATRVAAALDFFYRWNDPTFFYCKASGREIMDHFRTTDAIEEQLDYLTTDQKRLANMINILNTFEGLSIAIDNEVVDDATAKRFFRSIVLEYWHILEVVIKKLRAKHNNARLWKEFEDMYTRWRT